MAESHLNKMELFFLFSGFVVFRFFGFCSLFSEKKKPFKILANVLHFPFIAGKERFSLSNAERALESVDADLQSRNGPRHNIIMIPNKIGVF